MKNLKLNRKLNIIHITHFAVILLFIIATNFVFVRQLLFEKVQKNIELSTQSFYEQNIHELNQIRIIIDLIKENPTSGNVLENPLVRYSLKHNDIFNYIRVYNESEKELIEDSTSDYELIEQLNRSNQTSLFSLRIPEDSIFTSITYLEKLDSNKVLVINYSNEKLNKYIPSLNKLSDGGISAIYSKQASKIIYHPDLKENNYSTIQSDLSKITEKFIAEQQKNSDSIQDGYLLKNIHLSERNGPYLIHAIYNPTLDWFYIVGQPYLKVYSSIYDYFKKSSIVLLIIVFVMIWLTIGANMKQFIPLRKAINELSNNEFIKLNSNNYKNEILLINHSSEMLKKQINRYKQSYEQALESKKQREQDLLLAKQLQKNILPSPNPKFKSASNIDISIFSKSKFEVGGDLYDYFLIDKDHLLFSIGDVSGKGISSALYMTFVHTLLRAIANPQLKCNEILEFLNNKLLDDNISDLFVTMFIGILNYKTGSLEYSNAAHTHPFLIEKNGNIKSLDQNHGIPIGIYKNKKYNISSIQLNNKDNLFLYTDGLSDAADENGMKYNASVLKYNLMGTWFLNAKETIAKIHNSVKEFKGNVGQEDDMTLMSVKFKQLPSDI